MDRGDALLARRGDVVEEYHGTTVADPYRWLEEADAPETVAWVAAQNRATTAVLSGVPERAQLERRLRELWNYPRHGVPERRGERLFLTRQEGLQNQAVLYVQEGPDGRERVLIDPNTFSADGTVALSTLVASDDGELLAYGISRGGSDWQELKVREVTSGRDSEETIRWCKFTSVAWAPDGASFYYSRFPTPGMVPPEDEAGYNRVYRHRVGTVQDEDVLIHEQPDDRDLGFDPSVTDDGRYLLLRVYRGTSPAVGISYRALSPAGEEGPLGRLLEEGEAAFEPIETRGTHLYVRTDLGAPRGRVVAIDLERPEREHWREIIAEAEDTIDGVVMVGERLVVVTLRDASHRVALHDLDGRRVGEVPLPALGSVSGLSGRRRDTAFYLGFTSFLHPVMILRHELGEGAPAVVSSPRLTFDPALYETTQVFVPSRDLTRVPMFLTHRKGLALDGHNPTLLYGYGGFTVSLTPDFSPTRLAWLEAGGIFASVNLRGGGEYGEEWHRAGMLEHKQTVFDDFIAAAEWLIGQGYTTPSRLASNGASNGGLLVAACLLQRPDLFGAVVCQVPVTDMLRYHRFTIGRYWVSEYGNAEADETQFHYLRAYSPLHTVVPGTRYPPTLITSADSDDRVVPAHAKKFAATLQAAQAGDAPILLRVDTRAGHGAGKPTSKVIDEQADIYAFLFRALGMLRG